MNSLNSPHQCSLGITPSKNNNELQQKAPDTGGNFNNNCAVFSAALSGIQQSLTGDSATTNSSSGDCYDGKSALPSYGNTVKVTVSNGEIPLLMKNGNQLKDELIGSDSSTSEHNLPRDLQKGRLTTDNVIKNSYLKKDGEINFRCMNNLHWF